MRQALLGTALLLTLGLGACGPCYYSELNYVREQASAIPGVTLTDSGGSPDMTFENIWIRLEVEGRGEVTFEAVTYSNFTNPFWTPEILISSIAGLEAESTGCHWGGVVNEDWQPVMSRWFGYALDVSPSSDFAEDLGGGMRTIPEAVERFDEIVAMLESWPRCPNANVRGEEPERYFYCSKPVDAKIFTWPNAESAAAAPDVCGHCRKKRTAAKSEAFDGGEKKPRC